MPLLARFLPHRQQGESADKLLLLYLQLAEYLDSQSNRSVWICRSATAPALYANSGEYLLVSITVNPQHSSRPDQAHLRCPIQ